MAGGQEDPKKGKTGAGHSLNRKEAKLPPTIQPGSKKPAKKGDDLWVSKEAEHL